MKCCLTFVVYGEQTFDFFCTLLLCSDIMREGQYLHVLVKGDYDKKYDSDFF